MRNEILQLTKQLVQIQSVVNTNGEKRIAEFIYNKISSFPYFKKHSDNVLLAPTINDDWERYNVMAFVKGTKGHNKQTIILMGHLDTVGVDDFNHLKDVSCSPDTLQEKLKQERLPNNIQQQLFSNDWLFGRGVLDMKSGLASNLYHLKYYSEHPEELNGNLVFIAECDEENGSNGILSALDKLNQWKLEHNFHYIGAINADFVSPEHNQDDHRYIYKGTIGKLLPTFFVTGAETHVGSPFEGLDPNYIIAELTRQISYNPALCNDIDGEVTAPPISLKQTDLKKSYTVQTALSAFVYFNFFTHSWSPHEVLDKLKEQALIAFNHAIESLKSKHDNYCSKYDQIKQSLPWKPKVLTFKEMENILATEHGDTYTNHMEQFKKSLMQKKDIDVRLFAVQVVEEAWSWMRDKSPAIILFYSSLYSPSVITDEKTQEGKQLIEALNEAMDEVQPQYNHPIVTRNFFPHISDMSFVSLQDDEEAIQAVSDNNPAWGSKHYVNYPAIRALNVPVINIGPYGMDAHKKFERTEKKFTFEIMPRLTSIIIKKLLS